MKIVRTGIMLVWGLLLVLNVGCSGGGTTIPGEAEDSVSDPVPEVDDVDIPPPE